MIKFFDGKLTFRFKFNKQEMQVNTVNYRMLVERKFNR